MSSEKFGLPNMTPISSESLKAQSQAEALKPKVTDFKGRKGFKYWERKKPDGKTEVGCSYPVNDGHGKLTRQAEEVWEAMKPSVRADSVRLGQHVVPMDGAGSVHILHREDRKHSKRCTDCGEFLYYCECAE